MRYLFEGSFFRITRWARVWRQIRLACRDFADPNIKSVRLTICRTIWFVGASIALTAVLADCSGLGGNPFSLPLAHFNEDGPQQPAAIMVSDAPIFSREALINDRLREVAFLETLLEASEKPEFANNFTPQLARDLVNEQALALSVKAMFDPTSGAAIKGAEVLQQLQQQIQETNLRTQLIQAQTAQSEALKASTSAAISVALSQTNALSPQGAGNATAQSLASAALASSNALSAPDVDKIKLFADALLSGLDARADKAGARQTVLKGTPTEVFHDIEAYRDELRQELAKVNLDDLHDYQGNALYRLQFLTTVMPGQYKDKFGVARLTFLPPQLTADDIAMLYRDWLAHLTDRMNPLLPEPRGRQNDRSYQRLASVGLFRVLELDIDQRVKACRGEKDTAPKSDPVPPLLLAIPKRLPEDSATVRGVDLGTLSALDERPTSVSVSRLDVPYVLGSLTQLENSKLLATACERLAVDEIRTSVEKNLQRPSSPSAADVPAKFVTTISQSLLETSFSQYGVQQEKLEQPANGEIEDFLRAPSGSVRRLAAGDSYTYATYPIEQVQRVSTIARSANSLQLSLALAAMLGPSGVSADVGANYVRAAAGNVEALERAPIVIGFADRRAGLAGTDSTESADNKLQAPQAGWVFGPAVRINAADNKLELAHTVANYNLAADVSLPGWWPRVRIVKETAWVGNWWNTGDAIQPRALNGKLSGTDPHTVEYSTPLPRKPADLDSFTNMLSQKLLGGILQKAEIRNVDPFFLSACEPDVEISIRGPNVWRSAEVRLGGVEAEPVVKVLPDMEGVVAHFNLKKLFASTNSAYRELGPSRDVTLSVATRNGTATQILSLGGSWTGSSNGDTCVAASPFPTTRDRFNIEVHTVSPNRVIEGATTVSFLVAVGTPQVSHSSLRFFLNGVPASPPMPQPISGDRGGRPVYQVTFTGANIVPNQVTAIPLDVVGEGIISTYPIAVVGTKAVDKAGNDKIITSLVDTMIVAKPDGSKTFSARIDVKGGAGLGDRPRLTVLAAGADSGQAVLSNSEPRADISKTGRYIADFEIGANDPTLKLYEDGRKLSFALVNMTGELNGAPKPLASVSGAAYFYTTAASAKVNVTTPANATAATVPVPSIGLQFPANIMAAYPAIKTATMVASIADHPEIKLTVDPQTVALGEDGTMTIAIKLDPSSGDNLTNFNAAHKGNALTVKLDFAGAKGAIPTLPKLTITAGP